MREFDLAETLAEEIGSEFPSSLVAIDGLNRAGKSTLASQLGTILSWEVVELDSFLGHQRDGFVEDIDFDRLRRGLEDRPLIVEGVCVLDVLERLSIEADCVVYVKRVASYGFWHDEEECDPQEPVEDLISRLADQTNRVAHPRARPDVEAETGPSDLSAFRQEVIRYHGRVRPLSRAQYVFLSVDTS